MPPLRAVSDGRVAWLWDGFLRIEALKTLLGKHRIERVDCMMRRGTREDAMLLAAGANAEHDDDT